MLERQSLAAPAAGRQLTAQHNELRQCLAGFNVAGRAVFRRRTTRELNLNFVWAYRYITRVPEGHLSKVWFDDIVVATEYVGPIRK